MELRRLHNLLLESRTLLGRGGLEPEDEQEGEKDANDRQEITGDEKHDAPYAVGDRREAEPCASTETRILQRAAERARSHRR